MNAESYFEENPWEKACAFIREGSVGKVVALSVQCVCESGGLDKAFGKWKRRVDALLGAQASSDTIRADNAISMISKYENGEIVRFFIDDSSADVAENFEIVCKDGLVIWKPNVRLQGRISSGGELCFDCDQAYAADLGGSVSC